MQSSKSSKKVAKNRCVFSLLCGRRVVLLVTFAKMMFDEAELFKGLTAWFSSSVSASVQSQWVKNGGRRIGEINDADYIFSSSAAAEDTLRIFESQKYQNEELTIFNSSLIEDTVANGKTYLSGKYTGSYILIHPAYQREIEGFHKKKCSRFHRSNIQLTAVVDDKKNGHTNKCNTKYSQNSDEWNFKDDSEVCMTSNVAVVDFTGEYQVAHNESSHEWDFKDESNIHITSIREARKSSEKPVNCSIDRNCHLLSNPGSNSVSKAVNSSVVKQSGGTTLSNKQQKIARDLYINPNVTSLTLAGKGRRKCLAHDAKINILDENYSANSYSTNHSRNPLEDKTTGESYLDDTYLRNKVTSAAPASGRSHFLSSMDDGVVHIDDITLPVTPIDDFIPNRNGCRVDSK